MNTDWTDRRKGYRYSGVLFSTDGARLTQTGIEYSERAFSAAANKRFGLWLALVLLFVFPGIPLLAYAGLSQSLPWIAGIVAALAYGLHRRIHVCPGCGRTSKEVKTPHMGAPVLYLCSRCRTFFEHGEIDGGWPWK